MAIRDYANKRNSSSKFSPATRRQSTRNSKTNSRSRSNTRDRKSHSTKKGSIIINFNPALVMVALVGLVFISAVLYLEYIKWNDKGANSNRNNSSKYVEIKQIKQAGSSNSDSNSNVKSKTLLANSKQPKFEFYHTLPNMEVAVKNRAGENINSNVNGSNRTSANSISQKNNKDFKEDKNSRISSGAGNNYILQLASFKDIDDANELRAKLILAGFDVTIQTIRLDNGEVWHRVKTNKITNLARAEYLSSKLQEHKIKSIMLTEKRTG